MDFNTIKSNLSKMNNMIDRAKTDSGEAILKVYISCIESSINYIEDKITKNVSTPSQIRDRLIEDRLLQLETEYNDFMDCINDPDICYTEEEFKNFEKNKKPTFDNLEQTLDDPDYLNYLKSFADVDRATAEDISSYYNDYSDLDYTLNESEYMIEDIENQDKILNEITELNNDENVKTIVKNFGQKDNLEIDTNDFISQINEMKNQKKMIDDQIKSLRKSYLKQSGLTMSAITAKVAAPLIAIQKDIINYSVKCSSQLSNILSEAQKTAKSQFSIMKQNAQNLTKQTQKCFRTVLEVASLGAYSDIITRNQNVSSMQSKGPTSAEIQNIKNTVWKNGQSPVDKIKTIPNLTKQKIQLLKQKGQSLYTGMENDISNAVNTAKTNINNLKIHLKNNVTLMNGMMKANILGAGSALYDKVSDFKQKQANKLISKENEIHNSLVVLQQEKNNLSAKLSNTPSPYQSKKLDLSSQINQQKQLIKAMGNPLNVISMKAATDVMILNTKQTLHNHFEAIKETLSNLNQNVLLNNLSNQYKSVEDAIDYNFDAYKKVSAKLDKVNNQITQNKNIANNMMAAAMHIGKETMEIVDD